MSSKNDLIKIKKDERQNILPIKLKDDEEYYFALTNLQMSFTGRLDVMFANTFISEVIQLITNAIVLFKEGYFDAAFYSLRESLEISTTTIFFVDDTEENRKETLRNWKNQGKFPGHKQMIEELKTRAGNFSDLKKKMSSYFQDIETVKKKVDKYVHKQ
ncbi:MAG TPA: teicoplanin resistance protein VanZ, partial [Patescibacteria group bacterium]